MANTNSILTVVADICSEGTK